MHRWESDFREFVAASAGSLRRQAFARCGDWAVAERIVQATLIKLYRRWPALGLEPPEAFAQRKLLFALRRYRRASAPEELEPPMDIVTDALIVAGRRGRSRDRLVAAVLTLATTASLGLIFVTLAPGLGGGPGPNPVIDCMDGIPGPTPLPSLTNAPGVPADVGVRGLDRLAILDLPLPQPANLPPAPAAAMACIVASQFVHYVNPPGLARVDLGLADKGDLRPLAALPDPEIAPGALTVSVQVISSFGYGTITIAIAPTSRRPDSQHCDRVSFCRLSSVGDRGEVMEQYGLRDGRDAWDRGYSMGQDAEVWAAVVYTGHTMVLVSITNTPDVRAAMPATRTRAPLGAQITILALDRRLALYDPIDPSDPAVSETAAQP